MRISTLTLALAPFLCVATLIVPQTGMGNSSAVEELLTPEQQGADLAQLVHTLEALHPGLHRYTSVEDWKAAVASVRASLVEEQTVVDLFRCLAPLVALVRCCHSALELPDALMDDLTDRHGVFPLPVQRLDDRWWIAHTSTQASLDEAWSELEILPGTEVLSINGQSMPTIEAEILKSLATDGFIETGPLYSLSEDFAIHYALHVEFAPGEFDVVLRTPAGKERSVTVQAAVWNSWAADKSRREPFSIELFEDESLAVLDVRTFDVDRFGPFLDAAFEGLARRKIANLVLDLRGNGGGTDEEGARLCSYFFSKPFGYFDRIEVTAAYETDDDDDVVTHTEAGRRITSHSGLAQQAPSNVPFKGRVFVLVDGGTLSTAADVAAVLHFHGLATFLGEESGGGYDGNTSGDSSDLELAESGLYLDVQEWMYTTANLGHPLHGRGTPVEYPAMPTLKNVLAGEDPCMGIVREILEQERGR